MDENKIKELWRSTNEKLEETFVIHMKNTEDISKIKVQSFVNSMKPIKVFALLIGIVWVAFGVIILSGIYLNAFSEANKFFLYSASLQVVLTALALFIYLYQLITIHQVDITESILKTQEKLASLKTSTLWVTRILFLQLPAWTTFYWNETMFRDWNLFQWTIQGIISSGFAYAAIWLFFNIKLENRDKKWFKLIFNEKEWTPLMKAMAILKQVEEYNPRSSSADKPDNGNQQHLT